MNCGEKKEDNGDNMERRKEQNQKMKRFLGREKTVNHVKFKCITVLKIKM